MAVRRVSEAASPRLAGAATPTITIVRLNAIRRRKPSIRHVGVGTAVILTATDRGCTRFRSDQAPGCRSLWRHPTCLGSVTPQRSLKSGLPISPRSPLLRNYPQFLRRLPSPNAAAACALKADETLISLVFWFFR